MTDFNEAPLIILPQECHYDAISTVATNPGISRGAVNSRIYELEVDAIKDRQPYQTGLEVFPAEERLAINAAATCIFRHICPRYQHAKPSHKLPVGHIVEIG